jgi:2-polyprenyl-3-methyl-5-hydroxy-6-metoxy-1,4-benzoquinol methylase
VTLEKSARILDCGAAYGALMEAARDAGWQPYGIELPSEASAAIARKFGADRVFAGPFEEAHFPSLGDAPFDAVFMCDFIEHVRDPVSVLRRAANLLRPGGHLVATTPNGSSLSSRVMGAAWPHAKVEHLYFYDPHNFARLLDRAGLRFVRAGRASKVLDLDYLQRQFATYPRFPVTQLLNMLTRCAPSALRRSPLSFSFGEMLAVAVRSS